MRAAVGHEPVTIDFMHAAALPTSGPTALTMLEAVNLRHYQTVLIISATGGVGSYAVQMSALNEARGIATARTEAEAYIHSQARRS